jgi:16S rRNA processing protein RimM
LESSDTIVIGKITGAHGLKGVCKVVSFAESPTIFEPGRRVTIRLSDGSAERFEIEWSKPHRNIIHMAFSGITDRNLAQTLIGSEIMLARAALPEPEEGAYYWFDIIGLAVYHVDKRYLGRVESIMPTGSNDVYVVKDPEQGPKYEVLIPAVDTVVLEIDTDRRIMRVDLPEELLGWR